MTDAAIHRVSHNASGLSLRLLAHSGSPRAYALAMTRVVRNEVCGSITACSLSLRGGNEVSDAAIHRVSRERTTCLFAYWFTVDRHGLTALAMTRVVENGRRANFIKS